MSPASRKDDYCVYMLETDNGSYYTGSTNNLQARYRAHSEGRGARYTRINKPVRLLCSWHGVGKRGEALRLEYYIKKQNRNLKERIVEEPMLLAERYSAYIGKKISLTHIAGGDPT